METENKTILSKAAGGIMKYIAAKKPSDIIPFRGKFPIIEEYELGKFNLEVDRFEYLEDASEWMQRVCSLGNKMRNIEESFLQYLGDVGEYENFDKMSVADKSTLLVKFMNKNCLTLDYFRIE